MDKIPDLFIQQAEQLFKEEKYQEIIRLLTDKVLARYNSAILYTWRARAHDNSRDVTSAFIYAQKAIDLNPLLAQAFWVRGNTWSDQKEYDKAIEDYTKAIQLDDKYTDAYNNRGIAWKNKKEYDKAIEDYTKTIQLDEKHTDAYNNRGIAWKNKKEYDKAIEDYTKAIQLDRKYVFAYNNRGIAWGEKKEYDKAIEDFTKAIQLDEKYALAYFNRGNEYRAQNEYNKAIADFTKSIQLDEKYVFAYLNRGIVYRILNEYDKAIQDYTKAIQLDEKYISAYFSRGNAYRAQKEYIKAIADYTKTIQLDEKDVDAYNNRGNVWLDQKEYDKAIEDYTKAIQLNREYADAYYNRAIANKELRHNQEAVNDYRIYVNLTNDPEDYWVKVALSRIEELEKKIKDIWYNGIDTLVSAIKKVLLFEEPCISHYTSLSGAKAIILGNTNKDAESEKGSLFRLSEGTFLNDTSEGKELFKYLSFSTIKQDADDTVAEIFSERPFIGSFVSADKHDDLTLWRMYGKEAQAEAKGCALTIYKDQLVGNLKDKLSSSEKKPDNSSLSEGQFTFYKVAYKDKEEFLIPGSDKKNEKRLNKLMNGLKDKIKNLNEEQRASITQLLNDIVYLFKTVEYQYEHEVRLVVSGVGFKKVINKEASPPRVYIELIDIVPVLHKVTLGPKVERADEWAAAFNYHIKENYPQSTEKVEIVISHLPFK